jgi:Tfp pilus assembly protein PilX
MKQINRLSGHSFVTKAGNRRQGSILVILIILMAVFALLGVGMVSMFGSSILSAFTSNSARRANYMAESGIRYTISELRNAPTLTDKETAMADIDDGVNVKWFNVFPGVAGYRVLLYPSWSRTAVGTGVAATVVNATVPNSGFPPGYAIPGVGVGGVARLQVAQNNLVGINSYTITPDANGKLTAVTYNLASAVAIPLGVSAYANLAFPTTNPGSPGTSQIVTKGSTATPLVLNTNSVIALPQRNGEFMDYTAGRLYTYRTARVVGANVQLENIGWSGAGATATFPENSYLVFSQSLRLDAIGSAGGGAIQTQRTVNDAITLFTPGSPLSPPGPNQYPTALPPAASGFSGNLDALDTTRSGDRVVVAGYIATGGAHAYWAAFKHLGEAGYRFIDPEEAGRNIGYHVAPISNDIVDNLRNSWMQYHTLNYDVQIKNGWDLNHPDALSGIVFRWHESPLFPDTTTYQDTYEGYGLCFMEYNKNDHSSADMIPNTVKPPGLKKNLLLVLWEQKVNASGVPTKDWLAYAVLGQPKSYWNPVTKGQRTPADPDQKVTGYQVWPDGTLNDNSTLLLRVEDRFVTTGGVTTRYNEIKVFYGDASEFTFQNDSRTQDSIATNKARARYYPRWLETGDGGTLAPITPQWPPNRFAPSVGTIANWVNYPPLASATAYDYFTLTSSAPTGPYNTVTWVKNNSPRTGFSAVNLLNDKGTIRTTDFVIDSFPSGRKEIGLFAMGDMNSTNRTIAFDDFYIQILGGY